MRKASEEFQSNFRAVSERFRKARDRERAAPAENGARAGDMGRTWWRLKNTASQKPGVPLATSAVPEQLLPSLLPSPSLSLPFIILSSSFLHSP